MDASAMGCEAKGVTAFLAGRGAKYRRARFGREFEEPIALQNGRDAPP